MEVKGEPGEYTVTETKGVEFQEGCVHVSEIQEGKDGKVNLGYSSQEIMSLVRVVSVEWWADSETSVDSGVNWRLERGGQGYR